MRLVVVSDTHERHEALGVLEGDVLVHCGDSQEAFGDDPRHVAALDAWFGRQRFDTILAVGGNHDFALEALARGNPQPFRHRRRPQRARPALLGQPVDTRSARLGLVRRLSGDASTLGRDPR